jgi:hypothetical protein
LVGEAGSSCTWKTTSLEIILFTNGYLIAFMLKSKAWNQIIVKTKNLSSRSCTYKHMMGLTYKVNLKICPF